jgi:hypothetical protein
MNGRKTASSSDLLYENSLVDSRSKLNKLTSNRVVDNRNKFKNNLSSKRVSSDSDDFAINEIARVNNPYLNDKKTVHLPKIRAEKLLLNKTKYDDFNDKMYNSFKFDSLYFDCK